MHFDIHDFIRSLTHDRFSPEDPVIPDGVVDMSDLVDPLLLITRNGRALRSDVDYDHARFIGEWLTGQIDRDDRADAKDCTIFGLQAVILLIFDAVTKVYGDMVAEELLMMVTDRDRVRALARELSAVPYVLDANGNIRPNFASLSIFACARPITRKMLNGFVERHYLSTLPDLFVDDEEQDHDAVLPRQINDFEYVDADTIENAEVDPLNGFDEFERHFFDNHYRAYEAGAEIDDLINLDEDSGDSD